MRALQGQGQRRICFNTASTPNTLESSRHMPERAIAGLRTAFAGKAWQCLAIVFCVLFGGAMIANTQMGGEGMWFWYAVLFDKGLKLHGDLHLVLQPLYALEAAAWIRLFGTRCIVTEIPSVLQVIAFCVSLLWILRDSDWRDWQKGILLASAFIISVQCTAYRFDDYHLSADTFVFFSLALLLMLARSDRDSQRLGLAAGLGVLSGLTITTRVNDGVALLVAAGICLLVLARSRKILCAGMLVAAAALTVVLVVKITGDSLHDYVFYSVIKAAASKGGRSSILSSPLLLGWHALTATLRSLLSRKRVYLSLVAIAGLGALIQRYRSQWVAFVVPAQVALAAVFLVCSKSVRDQQLSEGFVYMIFFPTLAACYLLTPVVLARLLRSKLESKPMEGNPPWDAREILVLLPLAELASASASTAAQTYNGFLFSQVAMFLLLMPVLFSARRHAAWVSASFVTLMILLGLSGTITKVKNPYAWLNYKSSPMFQNRQWYQHPVYGTMYIDRDLLHFIVPVCAEITQGDSHPELLSLPHSYPNYFCDTPPWHGYVQTFYDTAARTTIQHLMDELNTAPPQWIVYQRQIKVMAGQQSVYSPNQPLAQQQLDMLIVQKVASGEWQLIDKKDYLEGDGWWIIRTRR